MTFTRWISFSLLVGAAACGSAPLRAGPGLDGTEWVLLEIGGDVLADGGPEATLAFDLAQQRVVGSAGCNRYFGRIQEGPEGGVLRVGPVGATRMMCAPPEMELERRFLAALAVVRRWESAGQRLRLSGDAEALVFGPAEAPTS